MVEKNVEGQNVNAEENHEKKNGDQENAENAEKTNVLPVAKKEDN